ncbi:fimbrial protein [Acinetobacter boissieri]|uniref:Pilin (Type 1 fimbria component protein) n=1 Tax=Acinetobacter boissieri TaxID=1219383 RepID=A0A1G6ITX8_9GAMM|nr:fimbrial protein [Acinetobacter boissieri]SDC09949.1 Pilin (type 1 fimbria component protein) [Acinetobacter boissieri]
MNKSYFLLLILICVFTCISAHADDCTISSGNLRGGSVSPTNAASTTHVYTASTITHASIISCLSKTNNTYSGTVTTTLTLAGSNIDSSSSVTNNGMTYYKIVNTGNEFVDNFAYVYFSATDNNTAGTPSTTLPSMVSNGNSWTMYSSATGRATQGLKLTPTFYFSKVPTSSISQNIIWGTLNFSVVYNGTTYNNAPTLYTTINFTPVSTKTCSVADASVTLPTTNISALSTSGSDAGRTGFTITATCSSGLASTSMTGVMLDANNVSNSTYLLSNTGTATDVSVKLYDTSNTAIPLGGSGSSFTFGTTSSSTTPTVSKSFYAVYHRNGSTTLAAGTVKSQATLSLFYN